MDVTLCCDCDCRLRFAIRSDFSSFSSGHSRRNSQRTPPGSPEASRCCFQPNGKDCTRFSPPDGSRVVNIQRRKSDNSTFGSLGPAVPVTRHNGDHDGEPSHAEIQRRMNRDRRPW